MTSSRLIDNYIVFRFLSFIFFFTFIILQYTAVEKNETPILPNPLSIIVFFIILFFLTLISQIIEPINYQKDWLLKRNLFASIPPLLGFMISLRFYKEEKKEKRDVVFELMAIVSIIFMGFFTLTLVLFLVLLYVAGSVESLSFYFLTIGIWGMLGITTGDSNIFYQSEIDYSNNKSKSKFQVFQHKSSLFLSKLFSTPKRRIIGIVVIVLFFYIYLVVTNSMGKDPITI